MYNISVLFKARLYIIHHVLNHNENMYRLLGNIIILYLFKNKSYYDVYVYALCAHD